MRTSRQNSVAQWVELACAEFGVQPADLDLDAVRALARQVTRDVDGACVPLTFFLLGMAVGRGMTQAEATSRVSTLVERWRGPDWRD